ncbi:MerR family transcriptional regulator [Streptomyces olindensis]
MYAADAPLTVRRIRALLDAGLPSRVIREVLDCVCGADTEIEPCMIPLLLDQLHGIEERIARLEGSRRSLSRLLAPLA